MLPTSNVFAPDNETHSEMGAPGWHATFVDRLRRAYRIGIPMAFGTDTMFAYRGETRGTLLSASDCVPGCGG